MSSTPQPVLRVRVTARDVETLRALLRDTDPDVGGLARRAADGSCTIEAFLSPEQAGALERDGVSATPVEDVAAAGRERQAEVGRGDRFAPAEAVPHGLADKV
ncbi:hypothetical protein QR97_14760 [Streptomyces sp. PBH53]|uniref:hypothetical protein n=1 Tax=Streptomyces sp. PBH53 TaxID=1577075 RepID=UPI000655EAB3|nr:hypothetical protein [Streptomyces sp. PBH53]AKN70908.1 hypothetical protein QR97_14760 [Streptomyces sp. PBH53]